MIWRHKVTCESYSVCFCVVESRKNRRSSFTEIRETKTKLSSQVAAREWIINFVQHYARQQNRIYLFREQDWSPQNERFLLLDRKLGTNCLLTSHSQHTRNFLKKAENIFVYSSLSWISSIAFSDFDIIQCTLNYFTVKLATGLRVSGTQKWLIINK